ncbi:hypothetical protein FHR83_002171 [Actinoplanes campanulatus]|uniref:Uncharacterized protein n=1 Tax=Actinoplanes campanulatus TaxID=113559 RepID=A0A7W5AEH8_9ACTN|nr:hypothetical protein [Actinoplanes campanulatus]MBB3094519.1 hypothetical protein [Actinoplanes campanulatus]
MPIKPVHGGDPMPLESPDDVATLVGHLERRDREPAWLGDHFSYLAGTRPDWFRPFQETVIAGNHLPFWEVVYNDACVLLAGASDRCVETLAGRLRDRWSHYDMWALAAIGTDAARVVIADLVRAGGDRQDLEDSGIWVPPTGPAEYRFTSQRRAVVLEPGDFPGADNPVGLPVERIVRDPATTPVVWHYASFRLGQIPGLPPFPAERAHLVAPASACLWTVFADIGADGRYLGEEVRFESGDDDPDEDYADDAPGFGVGRVVLRPYGPDLIYSNGNVHSSPGVVGTAGGPPIGLYPNPSCPSCKRLMFHALTVETYIREHGDGFRSLYLCEDCHKVASTATGWN